MRVRHAYEDDYVSSDSHRGGGQWMRLVFPLALVVVLVALLLLAPALISGYIRDWQSIGQTWGLLLQIAPWVVFIAGALWLFIELRHRWVAHPVHAKQGRYPALVNPRGQVTQIDNQEPRYDGVRALHNHQDNHSRAEGLLPAPEIVVDEKPKLPQAKDFRHVYELLRAAPANQMLYGYELNEQGQSQELWVTEEETLLTLILGMMGTGKSTTIMNLIAHYLVRDSFIYVFDGQDQLRPTLEGIENVSCPTDHDGYAHAERTLRVLAKNRLEVKRHNERATFPPVRVFIDEGELVATEHYPELLENPDGGDSLLTCLLKRWRKVNILAAFSNQDAPAWLLGGDNNRALVGGIICHYAGPAAARAVGLTKDEGGQLVKSLKYEGPGYAVVSTRRREPRIVNWTAMGREHLLRIAEDQRALQNYVPRALPMKPQMEEEDSLSPVSPAPEAPKSVYTAPVRQDIGEIYKGKVTEQERVFILQEHAAGKSATAIAVLMGRSPNFNVTVKQVIAQARREAGAQEVDA